jgi:hypothetical protein
MAEDILAVLKRHNDQLTVLLSREGLAELDRLAMLQAGVMGFLNQRINEYQKMRPNVIQERLQSKLGLNDASANTRVATDMNALPNSGEALQTIKDELAEVLNAYVKKLTAGIGYSA